MKYLCQYITNFSVLLTNSLWTAHCCFLWAVNFYLQQKYFFSWMKRSSDQRFTRKKSCEFLKVATNVFFFNLIKYLCQYITSFSGQFTSSLEPAHCCILRGKNLSTISFKISWKCPKVKNYDKLHRCFRQGNMPIRQAHCLLLIFWYTIEFVCKDTTSIHLHTIIKEIPS